MTTDWSPFFTASVDGHLDGTFEGRNEWLGVDANVVVTEEWSSDISAEMMSKIKVVEAEIASGARHVYDGPILNQDGEQMVAAGERLEMGILTSTGMWKVLTHHCQNNIHVSRRIQAQTHPKF